jgi:hypothetical protein
MGDKLEDKIEIYRNEIYDGTLESLENMIKNLKLEPHQYHFDVLAKHFYNHKNGIFMSPGDHYIFKIDEEHKIIIKS